MTGKTTIVTTAVQLKSALKKAQGGDTILLAPGDYGSYSISSVQPNGTVTIKSADPDADARFSSFVVTRSSNIVIEDIDISRPLAGKAGLNSAAFRIQGSSDISVVGVDVAGSLNNNSADDGHGISIVNSSRIAVLESSFQQLDTATVIARSSDIVFAGNTITETREGVNIAATNGALFDRNTVINMQPNYAAGDHPDAFQVHSGGTAAGSSDLAFRNNVIIEGTSGPIGGIFIGNEGARRGTEMTDISIENNYYQGTYRHGISASGVDGLVITGNTVIDSAKSGISTAITIKNVDGALIENNIAQMFLQTGSTDVTLANNIDVWESQFKVGIPASELFAPSAPVGTIDFDLLNPLANSVAATSGAGFRTVVEMGGDTAGTAALLAAYVPQFGHDFATHLLV